MRFPVYDELHGIFPKNEATAYGYLLHSFRKNYVFLLEKYTKEDAPDFPDDAIIDDDFFSSTNDVSYE